MHWFWRAVSAVIISYVFFLFLQAGFWWLVEGIWPSLDDLIEGAVFLLYPTAAISVYSFLTYRLGPQAVLERETRCRKCGYILRGIPEPRCSECGERI